MEQFEMPWHESAEDASAAAIAKSKKGFKEVAAHLYPSMTIQSAYSKLKNQLSDDSREVLPADTHIEIANFTGCFDYLYYVCSRTSHEKPKHVTPKDALTRLQADYIDAVKVLERITNGIKGLSVSHNESAHRGS